MTTAFIINSFNDGFVRMWLNKYRGGSMSDMPFESWSLSKKAKWLLFINGLLFILSIRVILLLRILLLFSMKGIGVDSSFFE